MFDIDLIIPCYGKSEIINKGVASIATQWKKEFIHVTLVNDCSPNTDCNYRDLVDRYKDMVDIRVITTPKNGGQGLARQFGVDNTSHDYFMFMDEDDQLGTGLSVSMFVGAVESANYQFIDGSNAYVVDESGNPVLREDAKPVCLVSGPLFAFDDNHSYTIDNTNRVWLNSKLYSRKFVEEHNIRFNEAQSRHAEDYFWMSCFFHAMDNDHNYQSLLLDNAGIYYLWYPNPQSQSRVDPHYGFMLAGYTMDGSANILKWMKDVETNNIPWTDDVAKQYRDKLLNMTMYSFFTFLSFVRHVATTDYVPATEFDWYILRNACNKLRRMVNKFGFGKYSYTEKIEQYFVVKNHSDVQFTEPWLSFDNYIVNGCDELKWDFKTLLASKKTMVFSPEGVRISKEGDKVWLT